MIGFYVRLSELIVWMGILIFCLKELYLYVYGFMLCSEMVGLMMKIIGGMRFVL